MNQKIKTLLRSPRRLIGGAVASAGVLLLVVSVAAAFSGQPQTNTVADTPLRQSEKTNDNSVDTPSDIETDPALAQEQSSTTSSAKRNKSSPTQIHDSPSSPANAPASVTPTAINVTLLINGSRKGSLAVQPDQNHCQVLQKAKDVGLIESLDMRWNTSLKTYGVYKINGLGDDTKVGWVYEVNEKSPPTGCSLAKPKDGDSINWKYLN